jgi:hypothetical protein
MGFPEPFEAAGIRFEGVGCCFCDGVVTPGLVDPVTLTVEARSDRPRDDGIGVQVLWCHAACLEATGMSDLHVTSREFWEDSDPEDSTL